VGPGAQVMLAVRRGIRDGGAVTSVTVREVELDDLPVFFDHQVDPVATALAAFPARDEGAFLAHWRTILADATVIARTVVVDGSVAGNVVSFAFGGRREIGYWFGREFWGRGVATQAVAALVGIDPARPLYASVAAHNVASVRTLEKCGFTRFGQEGDHLVLRLDR